MKIYFCDLCNESIPQEDLEQNRVTSVRGKMICARCLPSISAPPGSAASATAPAATRGNGRVLVFVSLLIGAGGLALAWDARRQLGRQSDPAPRFFALERSLDELCNQAARLDEGARDQGASLARVGAEPAKLREELAAQLARIEGIERDVNSINNLLANLRADSEKFAKIEAIQGRFESELGEIRTDLANALAKFATLSSSPPPAPPANPGAAPAKEPTPTLDAETKKLLADFNSKEGAVRWSAVDRIARRHDPTLLPYLLPMLDDADAFVQFRAIGAMRELNAKTSVGRLVKLLRDGDAIVREEAQDALMTLTGNPMRFDVGNSLPADREKGAKAWEDWFEKNKARFEEPAAPAPPTNG